MHGHHPIKIWSKTQATIAQSSAESELSVRGATEALGLVSLGEDMRIFFGVRLHIDAAAALGILERTGVGRVRHLHIACGTSDGVFRCNCTNKSSWTARSAMERAREAASQGRVIAF